MNLKNLAENRIEAKVGYRCSNLINSYRRYKPSKNKTDRIQKEGPGKAICQVISAIYASIDCNANKLHSQNVTTDNRINLIIS